MNISSFLIGYQAGKNAGGGTSADVRYVTFMSYDGSIEYGKKAVAVGDDCADPIARGVFDTPTRESTPQYNYTLAGWATTPNGVLDANALKAVEEDRTVYANFASVVRYYTITFYDSDGTTVLSTQRLAYGSMPSYETSKDGYILDGWNPTLTTVTGDASYAAVWVEKVTFAKSTWADIARVCEAGEAANYFTVGETRTITITGVSTCSFEIIGINHDDLADGSGKAGLTIGSTTPISKYALSGVSLITLEAGWVNSTLRPAINTTGLSKFPSDLQPHIKAVKKLTVGGTTTGNTLEESADYLFPPSATEFFGDGVSYTPNGQGTQYEHYKTAENRVANYSSSKTTHDTRSRSSFYTGRAITVDASGNAYPQSSMNEVSVIAFCI